VILLAEHAVLVMVSLGIAMVIAIFVGIVVITGAPAMAAVTGTRSDNATGDRE